jgi:hypothetical protein
VQHVYLVSWDGPEITPDERHNLKTHLGDTVAFRVDIDRPDDVEVAIDRLEPTEAHVKALLPPTERGVRVTPTVTESGMLMFDEEPA